MSVITNACTGGEIFDIAPDIVGKNSSGEGGMREKPSSTDEPSRSEESAGLSNVAGTPSIWTMTQKHRQRAINNAPFDWLKHSIVLIRSYHTDSTSA